VVFWTRAPAPIPSWFNLKFKPRRRTPPNPTHHPKFCYSRQKKHPRITTTTLLRPIDLATPENRITTTHKMKLLTLNFLTCAIKTCKTNPLSFPLHPRDAELEIQEADLNLAFLKNILPRLMWDEICVIASEVSYYLPNPTYIPPRV
jgi:hypothetical protein